MLKRPDYTGCLTKKQEENKEILHKKRQQAITLTAVLMTCLFDLEFTAATAMGTTGR